MQLFMAVPVTPWSAVSDFGGRRYQRFVPFNFLLSLAAPHLHGVLVLVTGNKFIASVFVTGDNCSPVSLSPAIIVHRCRWHPWEIYRWNQRHRRSLKIRVKDYSPVSLSPAMNLSAVSLTPVNSLSPMSLTGDEHSFANISANFRKNSKRPPGNTCGPGGQWFMKKT